MSVRALYAIALYSPDLIKTSAGRIRLRQVALGQSFSEALHELRSVRSTWVQSHSDRKLHCKLTHCSLAEFHY